MFEKEIEKLKKQERFDIEDLRDIIRILRSENGCPWDREQTHESIIPGFIEETYPGRPSGVTDVIKLAPSAASSGTGKDSAAKNTAVEYKAVVSYAGWTDESLIVSGALSRKRIEPIRFSREISGLYFGKKSL